MIEKGERLPDQTIVVLVGGLIMVSWAIWWFGSLEDVYVGVGPIHVFITEKEDDDFNVEYLLVFVCSEVETGMESK